MALPVKNAFAALVNQMGADRVLRTVESFVKRLLFWQENHGAVVSWRVRSSIAASVNCIDYVAPDVRCVVAVQVDDLLMVSLVFSLVWMTIFICTKRHFILVKIYWLNICGIWRWRTMAGYLIEIVLVSLRANDINNLVERHFGMLLRVS